MTSIRKTKKEIAKLMAELTSMRTHCKVRHYSREAKRYKERAKKLASNPWLAYQRYYEEFSRNLSPASFIDPLCIQDWMKYSRERAIDSTDYGWQNSDENEKHLFHASCLGSSPVRLYGEQIGRAHV